MDLPSDLQGQAAWASLVMRMDRPVGETSVELEEETRRVVKEHHAPPRPVHPSGTHPQPHSCQSWCVSGGTLWPCITTQGEWGTLSEPGEGGAAYSPLVHGCSGFQGERSRRNSSVGQACGKCPQGWGSVPRTCSPGLCHMSFSVVLENGGTQTNRQPPTPFYIRFHI